MHQVKLTSSQTWSYKTMLDLLIQWPMLNRPGENDNARMKKEIM